MARLVRGVDPQLEERRVHLHYIVHHIVHYMVHCIEHYIVHYIGGVDS